MSVSLFRVGAVWHYRFQIGGTRQQRSTRETDRHRAEQIADRALRQAKLWTHDSKELPTLRELVAQWLVVHQRTASRAHAKVVDTFGRLHLYELADVLIDELSTDRVELARVRHLESHAPVSANQWLKVLRLLCNWAVRRGILPAVPFRVRALKVQKKPRAILPVAMALAWLDAIDAAEGDRTGVRTAVRLMLGLGLRESETTTARWEWLDVGRQTYTPGRTKGREADPLPVPAWLIDYLMADWKPAGPILQKANGRPYPAGITLGDAGRQPGRRRTPHHRASLARHVRHAAIRGWCAGAVDPACPSPQEPHDDRGVSRGRHGHRGRRPATHRREDRFRITPGNAWRASGELHPATPAMTRNHDPKW